MHVHNHILYVSHNTHLSQVSKSPHVSRKLKNIMVDAPLSHICFPSQQTFHLYRKKNEWIYCIFDIRMDVDVFH